MTSGRAAVTLVVGRSVDADIRLADPSIAERHAELVITADGRYHLTDCASGAGTWRRPAGSDGPWQTVRQAFVGVDDALRFGDHACAARALVSALPGGSPDGRPVSRGRVERDPLTGEIVRKRL